MITKPSVQEKENKSKLFGKIYAPFSIDLFQAPVDEVFNVLMCFFTCHLGVILAKYTKKVDKLMWVFKWDNFRHVYMKVDTKYNQVSLWNHFLFHWIYYKFNKICEFFELINVKKNYFEMNQSIWCSKWFYH